MPDSHLAQKKVNKSKIIYIPTVEFEKFIIVANRLPIDTKITSITHAINQNAYILFLSSDRFPVARPLDSFEILEKLMFKYRGDLWVRRKLRNIRRFW